MDLFERARGQGPGTNQEPEHIVEGTMERITFAARDGAFIVARLQPAEGDLVTIVGPLPGVPVGARLRVRGHYETNARFGRQLRVVAFTELAPETLEGIRRYLGSGLIKGIGKEMAGRIVDRFGLRTLEVLDTEPSRLREVQGLGRQRVDAIRKAWQDQKGIRDVMVFLQGHGVSTAFAARIFKRYGTAAIARVRENPYRLAFDVWGIGFLSADRLAERLGVARDSPVRIQAGLRHVLEESGGAGHVFLPRTQLVEIARERLGIDDALVQPEIDRLGREGVLALEADPDLGSIVFESGLYRAERTVAKELARLVAEPPGVVFEGKAEEAVAGYERMANLELARAQKEALQRAISDKVLIVTGGPGVGKTTIVRGIVEIFRRSGLTVALAAPTGRAAKRLSEATGQPASTLHRLLEWRPAEAAFARNAGMPIEADLLVVDEASMLDTRLAADLLVAVAPGTRLLLVGDVDQLPSVGPGRVLEDAIDSGVVSTVRLTEIFRQAARSLIVTNAHRVNAGQMPELTGAPPAGVADERDFFLIETPDPEKAAELIRDLVATRLPRRYGFSPHEIQVLVPMHRGELGATNLNQLLQAALTAGAPEIQRGQRVFRRGDRVMQMRNNYDKDVFNGDIGLIAEIKDDEVTVQFDARVVTYESEELDELQLAYAATIHKSQGSEYPAVVVPIHTQHFVMLQKNLLYTAITRGKKLVVLVGTGKAVGMAVRSAQASARFTRLAERLRQSM